ncbi:cache domain-containing sensor histidine kinase [Paenibacillus whitsoniae]|uniref:Sensor histidine kinase n=1 Tax=Paenibacillus whitsoniae TaxID=2496558 RepID=A0A430J698_9BACL|nr:sensor histidine kinase [Paenibacillus whitsoniae]RTE04305.1 sensor histidine kinase [Paenibacillus whitsoniae]
MFKSLKLQNKIFIYLSLFAFIVVSFINLLFYYYAESFVEGNAVGNKLQTTQKIQEQMDNMLEEMDKLSISVNASNYIMNTLAHIPLSNGKNYFVENPQVSSDIKNILLSFTALQPLKERISLISKDGDYLEISNKMNSQMVTKELIRHMPEFHEWMSSEAYKIWLPMHPDTWSADADPVISLIRPLRDNYQVLGLVEVSYNVSELERITSFKNAQYSSQILLCDENQRVIYSKLSTSLQEQKNCLKPAGGLSTENVSHQEWRLFNETYMAFTIGLSKVNWSVMLLDDESNFHRPIFYLRYSTFGIYIIVLCIILALLYMYVGMVTRPIRRLKESLANFDMEKLQLHPTRVRTKNEITLLGQAFQDLLDRLRDSMNAIEQAGQREMAAHMNALQAQVNPHFLYNTLTVIGAYGKMKGNDEVMEMCTALADMLRYALKFGEKVTYLVFELQHIDNYLKLMSKRYYSLFQYHIDVDTSLYMLPIPKLILQPIVENAFQHAFKEKESPWHVKVTGGLKEGKWWLKIVDNGKGFDQVRLHELLDQLRGMADSGTLPPIEAPQEMNLYAEGNGIGLMNVFARLHLFYQGAIEIHIQSKEDCGTTIRLGGRWHV